MKRHFGIHRKTVFHFTNFTLSILLIVSLCASISPVALARNSLETINQTGINIDAFDESSDNTTPDSPTVPTANTTPESPTVPTDNTTPESPTVPTDNTTPESPTVPSDNTTPTSPTIPTDNTTPSSPTVPTDNATPKKPPAIGDNTTISDSLFLVSPDKDTEIKSLSGKITVRIPKGAVLKAVNIELKEYDPPVSTGMKIINLFELKASFVDSKEEVRTFNKDIEIDIKHDPNELRGVDVDSLRLYYLDEEEQRWLPLETSQYNNDKVSLTATTSHFTHFGEQANPLISGPGQVMAAQVNLHSGTAVYSYPLELPPGPGGFKPSVSLNYNSGSVDEMKSKFDVGSWVGIGWSLKLGSISYSIDKDEYYLNLNGASYELISYDGVNYETNPEEYLKITRSDNTWEVLDKQGNYYRFGGTTDSEQYVFDVAKHHYRWDLNLIRDTNSNEATISYVQNFYGYTVRSAYPEYLRYNNNKVEVHFISSNNRPDNPSGIGIIEDRRLDAIEIKVDSVLMRKYSFTYNTTECYYSEDYGGIYYAGKHTLTSIKQVGADGTSELPATTFTYQDKEVYRKTTEDQYEGNPGNPASIWWPHLIDVDSGYGGSISFSYTQIPDTTALNIWTREAVTTKTIDSGIGTNEVYTYAYTGNPYYKGTDWDQEFRGWNEVKVTDAIGNYVKHWYYTTGTINDEDAEKLSGREYKTQWYTSNNTLLREKVYDWSWEVTSQGQIYKQITPPNLVSYIGYYITEFPDGIAVSTDGYIYIADKADLEEEDNIVAKYTTSGTYITSFDSYGECGIDVSIDNNYYFTNGVKKYTTGGVYVTSFGIYGNDIAVSTDGYVYIAHDNGVYKYTIDGTYVTYFGEGYGSYPKGIDVSNDGYVYVMYNIYADDDKVVKFTTDGTYVTTFGEEYLDGTGGIAVSKDGYIYVTAGYYSYTTYKFTPAGDYVTEFVSGADIDVSADGYAYSILGNNIYKHRIFTIEDFSNWRVNLDQVEETIDSKTVRARYEYDDYNNVITEYIDGDLSTNDDDATVHRLFNTNNSTNILSKPARERVYATIVTEDNGGSNLKKETIYYYDGSNTSMLEPPDKGNVTRIEQKTDNSTSISNYFTYDSYGNKLTSQDPEGNITTWTYETTYHTYPATKSLPIEGLSESYTYDIGTSNLLSITGVNSQNTTFEYDTFKRLKKIIKVGDTSESPSVEYEYNNWGTINQQHLKTLTKVGESDYLWQSEYFDGLGRVVQTHSQGETGRTIISNSGTYNNRGLVEKQYVAQDYSTSQVNGYVTPGGNWEYSSYVYDALGRLITQNNVDGTTVTHDYSTVWQDLVTNERDYKIRYYYDAFQRLIKVEELNTSHELYATTTYEYDVLGNLIEVVDNDENTTTITYDWLSRKTAMVDPDMGSWSYTYDNNGNLISQTDAEEQTITFEYDELNRLTDKLYSQGSGMTDNVSYTYDSTAGGNYGKGQRTSMTDALGTTSYTYDARGRLITENRTVDSNSYITQFTYDGADRVVTITYPTGENVTKGYNERGMPDTLSGSIAGDLVTSTVYNQLGQITQINLGNGIRTTYGYWDVGGEYDNTGGYYGRLWRSYITYESDTNWLGTWENRVKITIDHTKVDENLTHFPVLIRLNGECGQEGQDLTAVFDEVGSNYLKIAVTEDDGESQLYVEVEKWDAGNEEAILWVSRSDWSISSTEDTVIYLYYDASQYDNTDYIGENNWLSGWENRIEITIDHTKISENLTHFPVLIHLSDNCGKGEQDLTAVFDEVGGESLKIAVTEDDGQSQLYVEVESWSYYYEEAWLWVSKSGWEISSTEDTVIYLYYDSSHADNTDYVGVPNSTPAQNVWNSNYTLVDHMRDDPDSSHTRDSSSNNNDGTKIAMSQPLLDNGYVYYGQNFDGNNDYIYMNENSTLRHLNGITVEAIIKPEDISNYKFIVTGNSYLFRIDNPAEGNKLSWFVYIDDNIEPRLSSTYVLSTDTWYHTAAVYNEDTGYMGLYIDGELNNSRTRTGDPTLGYRNSFRIGSEINCNYWDGLIDEVRISNTPRSAAWIAATYSTCLDELLSFSNSDTESSLHGQNKNVWDNNYVLVDHMQDYPDTGHTKDTTGNINDGTKKGVGEPAEATGQIGKAQDFNGSNDYINMGDQLSLDVGTSDFTIEMWVKFDNYEPDSWADSAICKFEYTVPRHGYLLGIRGSLDATNKNKPFAIVGLGNSSGIHIFGTSTINDNTWHHLTLSVDRDGYMKLYRDGVYENQVDISSYVSQNEDNDEAFSLGGSLGSGSTINGLMDETRISIGISRSAAWIKATYYTSSDELISFSDMGPYGSGSDIQDIRHTWDARGNLVLREDVLVSENETFTYDFLDRLETVSGAYSASYEYDEIGNMVTKNSVSYSYDSTQPHAVDTVGSTSYYYDDNGNMTNRGNQSITWNIENRPISISSPGSPAATFIYDGDGNRGKKTENGETVLYINQYYEKNITTGQETNYYYLGGRLVAMKQSDNLTYLHQDHLSGTSLVTNESGEQVGGIKYYPYGACRNSQGTLGTDKLFTGQRLDDTGLYYYNARYYDADIGRFISADTIVPDPANPQSLNRYSYVLNNPLKYIDPTGHDTFTIALDDGTFLTCDGNGTFLFHSADIDELAENLRSLEGIDVPNFPLSPSVRAFLSEPETTPEFNDKYLRYGATAAIVLVGNDITGFGLIDDILLPAVFWVSLIANTIENWDYYTYNIGKWRDSLTISFSGSDSKVIDDFQNNPGDWEKTGEKSEPATRRDYKGGTSVEETYRNKHTGQELERHRIYDPSGRVVHDHFRVK